MFIGHFGLALAAKRVAPKPSLGTLVLGAQLVDGVWPVFLLLGWDDMRIEPGITAVVPLLFVSYPYTQSLASVFGSPPPSVRAIALSGVLEWLFVAWAYWIDRHRVGVTEAQHAAS